MTKQGVPNEEPQERKEKCKKGCCGGCMKKSASENVTDKDMERLAQGHNKK